MAATGQKRTVAELEQRTLKGLLYFESCRMAYTWYSAKAVVKLKHGKGQQSDA